MKRRTVAIVVSVSAIVVALAASPWANPWASAGAPAFAQKDSPDNLKALFELLQQTIHVKKDAKGAVAIFQSLVGDETRLKKAFKADIAPDTSKSIVDFHGKLGLREADVGKLMEPTQTVVRVHGAKTEDIAKYEKGSLPYQKFPGGTQRVAERALRPGMTFYEVEFLEPGKNLGMKYHLIFWDGSRWTMLGPAWRAIK